MVQENTMTETQIKEIIQRVLPSMIKNDPEMERFVLRITRERYADRDETGDRFERLLRELKEDREEQRRKWDEETQRWQDQTRKWDEQDRKWDEQGCKWDEQDRKWDEQNRKWDENQKTINSILEEIKRLGRRIDVGIGAIGARWGIRSEGAFREALKGILVDSFGVRVERYLDFDPDGKIFGRPDQVEIDVIIKDGLVILCEIKSSISKSEVYTFVRKVRFYEEKHGVKANRLLVISPMVEEKAKQVAEQDGVEVYGYPEDIKEI